MERKERSLAEIKEIEDKKNPLLRKEEERKRERERETCLTTAYHLERKEGRRGRKSLQKGEQRQRILFIMKGRKGETFHS